MDSWYLIRKLQNGKSGMNRDELVDRIEGNRRHLRQSAPELNNVPERMAKLRKVSC
jgi:hypothetical protein